MIGMNVKNIDNQYWWLRKYLSKFVLVNDNFAQWPCIAIYTPEDKHLTFPARSLLKYI